MFQPGVNVVVLLELTHSVIVLYCVVGGWEEAVVWFTWLSH